MKVNYKQKLERKAASATQGSLPARPAAAAEAEESALAVQVHALAESKEARRVVFQSVAVTALRLIECVTRRTEQAMGAALSLGQREKLQDMERTLIATNEALRETLSEQGTQMLTLCGEQSPEICEEGSWWFALTEAIEALEESTQQMASLASGQPEGSAARRLGELVAGLLRRQHTELLVEADQWIS